MSIHRLTQEPPPAALMTSDFDEDRAAFKTLGEAVQGSRRGRQAQTRERQEGLAVINAAEEKADKILPRNTKDRNEVDKYLKALHGLIGMLDTPSIEILLAGVEKHPEATLGDLLAFMNAYNLRFGEADADAASPVQRLFQNWWPGATSAQAIAGGPARNPQSSAVGDFFSAMDYRDLQKKAPHRLGRQAGNDERPRSPDRVNIGSIEPTRGNSVRGEIIDGRAAARQPSPDNARGRGAEIPDRRDAWPDGRAGGPGPGEPGLCPKQRNRVQGRRDEWNRAAPAR